MLPWLKATLLLGWLPLTTAAIGDGLPGVPITWGGNELIVLDSVDFKREAPNAKRRDRRRFAAGVKAILNREERPERAFERLRKRLKDSICVTNNLAIAYLLSEEYDSAEGVLANLKELRNHCHSSEMRQILDSNCLTLGYLLSI
jgi:hypothetical protein